MFQDCRHTDLVFVTSEGEGVSGHRVLLAARCPSLRSLLSLDLSQDLQLPASSSDCLLQLRSGSSTVWPRHSSHYKSVDTTLTKYH